MILAAVGHTAATMLGRSEAAWQVYLAVAEHALLDSMPERVVSGMAPGWELAVAVAAVKLGFPLHAYLAYPGVDISWRTSHRKMFRACCEKAEEIVLVSRGRPQPHKIRFRDEAMVDASDRVALLWNGKPGGRTHICLTYAIKRGKPWTNYWGVLMK